MPFRPAPSCRSRSASAICQNFRSGPLSDVNGDPSGLSDLPVGSAAALRRLGTTAESFRLRRVKKLDGIGMQSQFAPASFGSAYTTVPNKTPTPAVIPMASAPQNVTRIMLGMTLAPPARAANAPKSARKSSEVPDTKTIRLVSGANAVTMRGIAAPTAGIGATLSERACRRPQYLQPPAPSCLPVDASDLPIRGGGAMAQRNQRGVTTVRAPVFRLERLNLTVPS